MEGTKYAVKHPAQGMLEAVAISQSEILDVLEELKIEGHGISIISGVDDPLFPMDRMQETLKERRVTDGFYAVRSLSRIQ